MQILKKLYQIGDLFLLIEAMKIIRDNIVSKTTPVVKLITLRVNTY